MGQSYQWLQNMHSWSSVHFSDRSASVDNSIIKYPTAILKTSTFEIFTDHISIATDLASLMCSVTVLLDEHLMIMLCPV